MLRTFMLDRGRSVRKPTWPPETPERGPDDDVTSRRRCSRPCCRCSYGCRSTVDRTRRSGQISVGCTRAGLFRSVILLSDSTCSPRRVRLVARRTNFPSRSGQCVCSSSTHTCSSWRYSRLRRIHGWPRPLKQSNRILLKRRSSFLEHAVNVSICFSVSPSLNKPVAEYYTEIVRLT
jgi:hypothetical protein